MKKSELNKFLLKEFKVRLKELNFKYSKHRFFDICEDYTISFGYALVDYYNIFPTTFGYSLSIKKVDVLSSSIFNKELERIIIYGENTVSRSENGEYPISEFIIQTENDAIEMADKALAYFKNEALPYLRSISNVESLDKIVNHNPIEPTAGVKGLILAKLNNNPEYDNLKKVYRQLFIERQWAIQKDIDELEEVIRFLDKHSKDELETIINEPKS